MTVRQLSDGNDDGQCFGQNSVDPIAFFGATATAQPASTAAITSTAAVSVSATQWGYATSTQATAIVTLLGALHANLKSLGLVAS